MAEGGSSYGGLHTQQAAFRGDLSRTSSADDDIPLMVRGTARGSSSQGGTFDMDDDMLLTGMSSGAKGPSRNQYHSAAYDFLCNGGWHRLWIRFWDSIRKCCFPKKEFRPRTLLIGRGQGKNSGNYIYPPNVIRNQKYSIISFVPMVLYEQFKVFLNLYFLVMALSQFIPSIRIGYLYTYWGPLAFVIFVTMCREAIDDIRRYRRDKEVNGKLYEKLTCQGLVPILSSEIQVGDLIVVNKVSRLWKAWEYVYHTRIYRVEYHFQDERVPADLVLLRTTEKPGTCFLRTDQLDGETDWKLRLAVPSTQSLPTNADLFGISAHLYAEKPQNIIHNFVGTFCVSDAGKAEESLSIENTLWSNTVLASGTALGVVIYSGQETRSVMNTSHPHSKIGLLDTEVNRLTKVLFGSVMILSIVMVSLKGFQGPWYIYLFRFILLFSYIIPISLRVNLDMGKLVYSWKIQRDRDIPGTVVRSTTLPEELGRISYVFSDKTGTLTQNEMVFKRLHLGSSYYSPESMDEVQMHLCTAFSGRSKKVSKVRSTVVDHVSSAVLAIALCHNVTPVYEAAGDSLETEADQATSGRRSYQASSPDEVALVTWTESVGLALVSRDVSSMQLRAPSGQMLTYRILEVFPFTSDSKRMGIIVQEESSGSIVFYMKGADTVMVPIVQYNDWLEEEVGNMAREGLRTLVVSRKTLTEEQYKEFQSRYQQAKLTVHERSLNVSGIVASLERDMELLCLTGVEDRLQEHVRPTLETLRNAAIKVWMLTGDKLETAICIAQSSRLVSKTQNLHLFKSITNRADAHQELNAFRRKIDSAFIITGDSLEICLKFYDEEFAELACQCPAVIVCRCSPTQKAEIVKLIKNHTHKTTLAIGDGGNDVSMIQASDVGVGIVGKEGKQASLAGDFSVNQFSYLARLLLVHGRDSYKRSASLSQFVIHRGLIISVMQAVFSSVFYFASVSLFPGFLMVGYATVFTMFPVFSLVLDKDVSADIAMTFPELYKDLTKGRSLSFKTFFLWVLISIYQGGIIMYGALLLFDQDFIHVLSITYTALILTELFMVALTIRTWHWSMILAQVASIAIYIAALVLLKSYFDAQFLKTWSFVWKVIAITSISCIPLYIIKVLRRKFSPPSYSKLNP